jgi:TP901 family phage tail tape measure protein
VAERRVAVKFSAEISNFKQAMADAAQATAKAKKASDDAGKAADQSAEEIKKQGLAHQEAAKAAGLQYDNTGQLVTMNGKAVSSQQAAALGLQTFSKEAYLAGRAAVDAGDASEAAAAKAAEAEKRAAEAAEKRREALERVGAIALTVGAATLAGVGMAVKAYADFDKQMSVVDSATHETTENMAKLRQAAIDAGADTAFSAVEAGKGIEELAKAGVSTKDILGGGLTGALSLAAAGSLDVGKAAEIAASALVQFKLSGDKVPHVADLLAAGAGKAQGSVEDLGMALNQSGLVAASTGLTIEETTGGLAAFASAGLVGSDAGTSFKTMLMSLNPNSKQAAELMEQLGLKAYDQQGKFIGLSEYAGVLQDKLKGLSDEQRNAALKTLFGSDAVRAANILYEQGAEGINKWEAAVNDAGFAADTAARMQNNLAGDLEKLGGSFDTVLIQSGSGANEVLRGLVQGLEGLVDAVGKVPAPVLGVGTALAALVGGAALVVGGLITVIPKINDTRKALDELAPAGGKARSALDKVGKAAEGIGEFATAGLLLGKLAEADYMSKIDTGMGRIAKALAEVSTNGPGAKTALDDIFKDRDGGDLINTVTDLESAIKRTFNRDAGQQFNDWGESVVNGMTGIKGSSQILEDQFKSLDKGLADLVTGGKSEDAAKSFDKVKKAAEDQKVSIEDLKAKFPQYADALNQAEAASKTAAAETDKAKGSIEGLGGASTTTAPLTEEVSKALEDIGLKADGTVVNLDKFTTALVNAGLLTLSSRDATAKFDEALDGLDAKTRDIMATEQAHGGVLNESKTDLDLYSDAGRAANAVLQDMTQKGIGAAQAMAANGESMPAVQDQLGKTYDAMVKTATGFGMGKEEAEALTRGILHIPPGVDVKSWMSDEAKRMAEQTKGAIDAIPPRKDVLVNIREETHRIAYEQRVVAAGGNEPTGGGLYGSDRGGYTGGRVADLMGFAQGGIVPGSPPANPAIDNVLALVNGKPLKVRSGEWIINEGSSRNYDRELAAINAGTFPKMPGYASGGRTGREYSAQALGYAPYSAAPGSAGGGTTFGDVIISQQSDPISTWHEFARRAHNLSV